MHVPLPMYSRAPLTYSTVTGVDGKQFQFTYARLEGTLDCAIDAIASQNGQALVRYGYQVQGGVQVGLLATAAQLPDVPGALHAESYSQTPEYVDPQTLMSIGETFKIAGPGGVPTTMHSYWPATYQTLHGPVTVGPGLVQESIAQHENLYFGLSTPPTSSAEKLVLEATAAPACWSRLRWYTSWLDRNVCAGDGLSVCGSETYQQYSYDHYITGIENTAQEGRLYSMENRVGSLGTVQATWVSPDSGAQVNEWACGSTTSTPALLDHPTKQSDARGAWTTYQYQTPSASVSADGTPITSQQTELAGIALGSLDESGAEALLSLSQGFSYGAGGQQLLTNQAQPSVLQGGAQAKTHFTYAASPSNKGNRLTSTIREGWTKKLDSGGTPVPRFVGTFSFVRHLCLGLSDDDLQQRTLEVHGPCLVSGATSTDCDVAGAPIPITQYFYGTGSGDASGAGSLREIRRLTNATGAGCASATYLSTRFDSYDSLGHPTQVRDPNGVVTALAWAGSKLTQLSRGADVWRLAYDHDLLTTIQYPESNYEVLCYRVGATGACSGGTWNDRLQWRARFDSSLSTWTERVDYTYWSDGTVKTESFRDPVSVRRVTSHGANVLRQPTYFKFGDDASTASVDRLIRQFDAAGGQTAIGFPSNNPDDFCGTPGAVSANCAATNLDRLGRLSSLDLVPDSTNPTTAFRTQVDYDEQGNIKAITPDCLTDGTCPSTGGAQYQYDDFGNVVGVTAPWLKAGGGSGTTRLEYDASGNVVKRQTPELAKASQYLASYFDGLGRLTEQALATVGGTQSLFRLAYDQNASLDSSCPQPAYSMGRLLRRTDSFGDTWYQYDAAGRVTKEIRLRTGVTACSSAALQDVQHTSYSWSANGNLMTVTYPFGRTVTYEYGNASAPDRPTRVLTSQYDGASWSSGTPLLSGIVWEPYGGLRAYIVDHQSACMPTYVNYRHVAPGGSADTHTGFLGSLTVSTTETGAELYRRDYSWKADQVQSISTYLLGSATPRTEQYGYDGALRLTSATRPVGNFDAVGGSFGSRAYGYDNRGNRTAETNEDCGYPLVHGSAAYPDQLTMRSGCSGGMLSTSYTYDDDGRVASMYGPNDSSGQPSWAYAMGSGPDGSSGAFDSVYKSIGVNGATYGYFYDAFNRRRAKQYPLGMKDEFYYRLDNLLLVDVGNDSAVSATAHPVDEYVWLGGRPVAVVRSKLDESWNRLADTSGADCTRNGSYQSCGTFAVITDHIGAPVLMLDDQRRVVGEGSMDPFGAVNKVTLNKKGGVLAETAHPYANNQTQTLADFKQPAWGSGTTTRLRASFALVDTEGTTDAPVDGVMLKDGDTGTNLLSTAIGGQHRGRVVSSWVTPSAGRVQAVFASDGGGAGTYTGAVMEGYEYQRFQTGAQPSWLPLRYPGQYADSETGLSQNWNRFYATNSGRFVQPEPIAANARASRLVLLSGSVVSIYGYAGSNPLARYDRNGLATQNNGPLPAVLKPEKGDSTCGQPDSGSSDNAVLLPPGETSYDDQDGFYYDGELYKTVRGVDATINPDGSVTYFPPDWVARVGQWTASLRSWMTTIDGWHKAHRNWPDSGTVEEVGGGRSQSSCSCR